MKFGLSEKEMGLLLEIRPSFDAEKDYDEEEAFALLDEVYAQEVFYAQNDDEDSGRKTDDWAHLADNLQAQIPEV